MALSISSFIRAFKASTVSPVLSFLVKPSCKRILACSKVGAVANIFALGNFSATLANDPMWSVWEWLSII